MGHDLANGQTLSKDQAIAEIIESMSALNDGTLATIHEQRQRSQMEAAKELGCKGARCKLHPYPGTNGPAPSSTRRQTMRVKQSEFHSMRGHVADGTEVVCESGAVVTIKSSMSGWEVRGSDGQVIEAVGFNALEVTRVVLGCP